jgi:hypothetical protein
MSYEYNWQVNLENIHNACLFIHEEFNVLINQGQMISLLFKQPSLLKQVNSGDVQKVALFNFICHHLIGRPYPSSAEFEDMDLEMLHDFKNSLVTSAQELGFTIK